MPDIVVHSVMGEKVLQRLGAEISSFIDSDIFRAALMGPDPYMFYRFFALPFRHRVNRRSNIMHRIHVNRFLVELAKRSQRREVFSFLAGFLCHYALDSVSHGFICQVAGNRDDIHMAIEHCLDVQELARQGKQRKELIRLFVCSPSLPEVRDALKVVYGWDDDCYVAASRHMKLYHWIVKDQHGLLNLLLCRIPGRLSSLSYQTIKADGLDLTDFAALEKESIQLGIRLIRAAYSFRTAEMGMDEFRRILGKRTYMGDVPAD